jgi:hypothetical protein
VIKQNLIGPPIANSIAVCAVDALEDFENRTGPILRHDPENLLRDALAVDEYQRELILGDLQLHAGRKI